MGIRIIFTTDGPALFYDLLEQAPGLIVIALMESQAAESGVALVIVRGGCPSDFYLPLRPDV